MIAPLLAAVLAGVSTHPHPCRAALPRGPVVPAPIVLHTSCGSFRLAPNGSVVLLPRRWLARHGSRTGRRWGADLAVRRTRAGRYLLLRGARVVWRSSGLYPNDGDNVAFGPHLFVFASYRRGVYLTDLAGSERRVVAGRGLYPLDFTAAGRLLVAGPGWIAVVAPDGRALRRLRFRRENGFAFDGRTDELFFVTPGRMLARLRGDDLQSTGPVRLDGALGVASPGLLIFGGSRSFAVTRRDGTPVARTGWTGSRLVELDSGVSVSPDGRSFAFRLSDARAGATHGTAAVYLLRAGETKAKELYRYRLGRVGCAPGGQLTWNGPFVLYRAYDGRLAVLDANGGRVRDLTPFAGSLPRLGAAETASAGWASDFR